MAEALPATWAEEMHQRTTSNYIADQQTYKNEK